MSKKKRNDQIPTPEQYVNRMLDAIGYKDHIVGKRILEENRLDDLKRSTEDKEFKEQLLKEFGIE